ncbi:MAG: S41 family peptidase [Candidatus Nealsonbacteria bacterium]
MFGKVKQNFVLFFLIILILITFSLGIWIGRNQVICQTCPPEKVDFSLFWETWNKIEEKYVGKGELDAQEMIYGAIRGMVNSLGDPYTVFLEPEDTKLFIEDVKGSFEGVGMEIGIKDNQLQVIAPLEGTPAQKAGLKAGDKIVEIDGESTAGITTDEAVKKIRGPKGTEVVLGIYRESWKEKRDVPIVRGVISIPSLKFELRDDNIAYIHLYQFSEAAAYDFREAVIDILESPTEKIVLDLRNNPGGYLEVAQEIAGWFLEKGQVVTIEDFGEGREQELYKTNGSSKLVSYPIVILINEGSASASEILAGALRDNRDIILVGATSFGKGSVQELEKFSGGSSLKVTVAKWLTPNGDLIAGKGLEPDIEIEITQEDIDNEVDSQLDKAIEILKNIN